MGLLGETKRGEERMSKTVSASEAKNRLGALIGWVLENRDEVIVESRGEPKVVLVPYGEYEEIQKIKEEIRRRQALAKLAKLRDRVRSRNEKLKEEEAQALADRFTREVVAEMVQEGKIQFIS
jgi:prevent-host-death family protein